jgi:hypothetical protein
MLKNLRNSVGAGAFVAATIAMTALAGAQTSDPIEDTITGVTTKFSDYSVPVLAGVATIVGLFIAIPLVKKFARMVRSAIG